MGAILVDDCLSVCRSLESWSFFIYIASAKVRGIDILFGGQGKSCFRGQLMEFVISRKLLIRQRKHFGGPSHHHLWTVNECNDKTCSEYHLLGLLINRADKRWNYRDWMKFCCQDSSGTLNEEDERRRRRMIVINWP